MVNNIADRMDKPQSYHVPPVVEREKPAVEKPESTTIVQTMPMTIPKAMLNELEMVFLNSDPLATDSHLLICYFLLSHGFYTR